MFRKHIIRISSPINSGQVATSVGGMVMCFRAMIGMVHVGRRWKLVFYNAYELVGDSRDLYIMAIRARSMLASGRPCFFFRFRNPGVPEITFDYTIKNLQDVCRRVITGHLVYTISVTKK